jgi:hypothetical protein
MSRPLSSSLVSRCFLTLLLLASSFPSAFAADLNLEAKLIWATDDEKSPDANHKPVDQATAEKTPQGLQMEKLLRRQPGDESRPIPRKQQV